jgi:hypothetical protein
MLLQILPLYIFHLDSLAATKFTSQYAQSTTVSQVSENWYMQLDDGSSSHLDGPLFTREDCQGKCELRQQELVDDYVRILNKGATMMQIVADHCDDKYTETDRNANNDLTFLYSIVWIRMLKIRAIKSQQKITQLLGTRISSEEISSTDVMFRKHTEELLSEARRIQLIKTLETLKTMSDLEDYKHTEVKGEIASDLHSSDYRCIWCFMI